MSLILQLVGLVFVVLVIRMTSSQPTVDILQQDNDVCTSGKADQILSILSQLVTMNSQLRTAVSRLETDVAGLKTTTTCTSAPKNTSRTGMPDLRK